MNNIKPIIKEDYLKSKDMQNMDRFKFKVFSEELSMLLEVIYIDFNRMQYAVCANYFSKLPNIKTQFSNLENNNYLLFELKKDDKIIQSTGLYDKNNFLIYEGDIVKWSQEEYYSQSSHVGYVDFEGYEIVKKKGVVFFNSCKEKFGITSIYCVKYKKEFAEEVCPLGVCGFNTIDDILEALNRDIEEKDHYKDLSETDLDESYVGIEIIGNLFENPELVKN